MTNGHGKHAVRSPAGKRRRPHTAATAALRPAGPVGLTARRTGNTAR